MNIYFQSHDIRHVLYLVLLYDVITYKSAVNTVDCVAVVNSSHLIYK